MVKESQTEGLKKETEEGREKVKDRETGGEKYREIKTEKKTDKERER